MPYLKEIEEDNNNYYINSKIERSYKIKKTKSKKTGIWIKILSRILFACLFLYFIIPYAFKHHAYSIYVGKIMNRNIKIETVNQINKNIVILPTFNTKKRVQNLDNFISPTLNYLNNGNLFGTNFIAKTNSSSKFFTHIVSAGRMGELENRINNIAKKYPELHPRVFVFNYKNGKTAEVNANTAAPLASTVKIPILFEMFRQIEAKNRDISIDKEIIFEDVYRSSGSGDLQYSQKNGRYTLDRIANLMITKSDNSATNLILDETGGMENINRSYRMWGLKSARMLNWLPDLGGGNKMSMKEMGELLYNLDNPNFLTSQSREKIKEYMGSLPTQHLLKAGIGADASIIHKTGDIGKSLADCGIVTLKNGNKYIITIAVERPHNNYKAKDLIEEVSKTTYDYLSNI